MSLEEGNIPVKYVEEDSIVEAFESAMRTVWQQGIAVPTEYDIVENKPAGRKDPASRDASVVIVVRNPFREPRIPKSFCDSLENLGKYIHEVVNGVRDYRVKPRTEVLKSNESADTRWAYTYHGRLVDYYTETGAYNQIDYIINRLVQNWYTRRAQAITWDVNLDPRISDPPCLQRVWCRLVPSDNQFVLNMNTHWRSHDLYKAWVENVIALTELQQRIAEKIAIQLNKPVIVGRYAEFNDSLHIYGSYFKDVENFFTTLATRPLSQRAWETSFALPFFKEGLEQLLREEGQFIPEEKKAVIQTEIQRYTHLISES